MKKMKKVILVVVSAVLLLMLCACNVDVDMRTTTLTVDSESFSGSRVMVFRINEKTDVTDETTKILEKYLPSSLKLDVDSHKDYCSYTFTLKFSSMDDYKSKVEELLGRKPSVVYEPASGELYSDGFTLTEDFTSKDLFKWAETAVANENDEITLKYVTDNASTAVVLDGSEKTSGEKIQVYVTPKTYLISKISIDTVRYGDNDYQRTISFKVDQKTSQNYGDKLESLVFKPAVENVPSGMLKSSGWNEDRTSFDIVLVQCSFANLQNTMAAVFPGSTIEYTMDETHPFKESGTLKETINVDGFACNTDLSANVVVNYLTSDNTQASETGKEFKKVKKVETSTKFESKYTISDIEVTLDISFTGKATAGIVLTYADAASSRSGATLAKDYFDKKYGASGITTTVETVPFTSASSDITERSILVISATGSDEEITEAMNALLGADSGYSLTIDKKDGFNITDTYKVEHNVNIASLVKILPSYSGKYTYTFTGTNSTVKNVAYTSGGKTQNDLLRGKDNFKTFSEPDLTSPEFSFRYQYKTINIVCLLVVLLGVAGVLIVAGLISRTIIKKKRDKQLARKEQIAKEAIKSVALAIIPESERGTLSELPPELTQRPSVILEPKIDDGLDEDDDEPENVWLFTTAMKLLALLSAILFFFPMASSSTSVYVSLFTKNDSISALNLVTGTELFGVAIDGNALASVLLIIPLVIIALLYVKDVLPKFIASFSILGLSVFEIIYLTSLSSTIEAIFEKIKDSADAKYGYITSPTLDVGYNYTLVVFVLIALGAVVMIGFDIVKMMRERKSLNSD